MSGGGNELVHRGEDPQAGQSGRGVIEQIGYYKLLKCSSWKAKSDRQGLQDGWHLSRSVVTCVYEFSLDAMKNG